MRKIIQAVDTALDRVGLYRNLSAYRDLTHATLSEKLDRSLMYTTTTDEVFRYLRAHHRSKPLPELTVPVAVYGMPDYTSTRDRVYIPYADLFGGVPLNAVLFGVLHECAHVHLRHLDLAWQFITPHIGGRPFTAKRLTNAIQSERSSLSDFRHQNEFDADRFAVEKMLGMGYDVDEIIDGFTYFFTPEEMGFESLTHPSASRRLLRIRNHVRTTNAYD